MFSMEKISMVCLGLRILCSFAYVSYGGASTTHTVTNGNKTIQNTPGRISIVTNVYVPSSVPTHGNSTKGTSLHSPFITSGLDNTTSHRTTQLKHDELTTKYVTGLPITTQGTSRGTSKVSTNGTGASNVTTDGTGVSKFSTLWLGPNKTDTVAVTKLSSSMPDAISASTVGVNVHSITRSPDSETPKTHPTLLLDSTIKSATTVQTEPHTSLMESVLTSLFSSGNYQDLQNTLQGMTLLQQLIGQFANTSETDSGISDVLRGLLTVIPELVDDNSTFGEGIRNILAEYGIAPNITEGVGQLVLDIQSFLTPESLQSYDQCIADFSAFLQGLGNTEMWSMQMLDASGKPGKSLFKGALNFWGNYDECMEVSGTVKNDHNGLDQVIKGEYWQLGFTIPSSLTNLPEIASFVMGGRLNWDVCLPASCNKDHVINATQKLPVDLLGIETLPPVRNPHRNWKDDPSAIVAVVTLCLIVSLSVVGTLYDVVSGEMIRRKMSDTDSDASSSVSGGDTRENHLFEDAHAVKRFSNGFSMVTLNSGSIAELEDAESIVHKDLEGRQGQDGFVRQLLLSFSIRKNTEKILNTKIGEGNLGCIHGIRVLSMAWVILGHSLIMRIAVVENISDYLQLMKNFTMQGIINGNLSVDTFFLLSGVLVCYLFLKESKKSGTGKQTVRQMVLYYVHRYWRLTPVYVIILTMYTGLHKYLTDGPNDISSDTHVDSDNCRENWWSNLLYINNLYKPDDMCMRWSWFLSIDMQFYVIAPLALLPIAFKLPVLGIVVMILLFIIQIICYGYFEWSIHGQQSMQPGNRDYMNKVYFVPWCRMLDAHAVKRFSNGFSMVTLNSGSIAELEDAESIVHKDLEGRQGQDGFVRQLLLSFSIRKNTEKILNTKIGEGNLGCIHGIRVLSMAWVILGHSLIMRIAVVENISDYLQLMKNFTMQGIINGNLSVDTFFLLSGVLVCYLFLKESKKSGTGKQTVRQMVLYYVHRYWRLTPVYVIILTMYTGLHKYLTDGPNDISSDTHVDSDNCRENWWSNLLYINNLYKPDDMCMRWSWFLSIDMQFYVIAPLALLPIAFKLPVLGIVVMILLFIIQIICYGYFEWSIHGQQSMQPGNRDYMNKVYFAPWCRVGVFAIGLMLGFILHKMKKRPRIPRYVLVIGWQIGLTIGLLCTYVTYSDWKDGKSDWPVNTRIIHETLFRPGWGLFVSWIIFVCCTGYGGVINSILSWEAWIPLGRLTYGAYLIHPIVTSYTTFSCRTLVYANITTISYEFVGLIVISYALSFIACVLVEAPCNGLEKAVLTKLNLKK